MLPQHFVEHEVSRFQIFEYLNFVDGIVIHSCDELAYILTFITFLQGIKLRIILLPLLHFLFKTLLNLFFLLICIFHTSSCLSHFRCNVNDLLVACKLFHDAIIE